MPRLLSEAGPGLPFLLLFQRRFLLLQCNRNLWSWRAAQTRLDGVAKLDSVDADKFFPSELSVTLVADSAASGNKLKLDQLKQYK